MNDKPNTLETFLVEQQVRTCLKLLDLATGQAHALVRMIPETPKGIDGKVVLDALTRAETHIYAALEAVRSAKVAWARTVRKSR